MTILFQYYFRAIALLFRPLLKYDDDDDDDYGNDYRLHVNIYPFFCCVIRL